MKAIFISLLVLNSLSSFSQDWESLVIAPPTTLDERDFSAPIQITIETLEGEKLRVALGGSEGHGGDYDEMRIINFGLSLVSQLEKIPETSPTAKLLMNLLVELKVEVVDSVTLGDLRRDAVNIPDQKKIYLSNEAFDFVLNESNSLKERAQFLLHELLPIIKMKDTDYQNSKRLSSYLEPEHSDDPYTKLLYSVNFNGGFQGISYFKALDICESVKKSYEKEYFATYCVYNEKFRVRYDYYYSRYRRIPYTRIEGPIYGLKVFGYGKLNQLREVDIIDGYTADMPIYRSKAEAIYNCTKIVAVEDGRDFLYYNAKCVAFPFEDGFKFSIKSKNPLLQ